MQLNILWLFPEVLNLYGDRGNIAVLQKRCKLRGIKPNVISCSMSDEIPLQSADIIYLGGGSDNDLPKVSEKLL
ncbi:MAG: glutamine amidotransferase, partial [Clostridia bacterium]|nr:glutamine amidotransferase [Clostridia bacterium]